MRFLTAGESHGPGLTVIVEGLPRGIPISEAAIARDLARRQAGYGRGPRAAGEPE
ncbi:MAG: chorismate synthase, partial [Bacteroidota bacterium]